MAADAFRSTVTSSLRLSVRLTVSASGQLRKTHIPLEMGIVHDGDRTEEKKVGGALSQRPRWRYDVTLRTNKVART